MTDVRPLDHPADPARVADWIRRDALPWLEELYGIFPASLRTGMNEDVTNLSEGLWALARHLETLTPTDR
jgi:zona occludens toxin (predicted ATPase)